MASYLSNMKIAKVLQDIFSEWKKSSAASEIFQKQQEVYLECMRSIYEAHKYFRDNQYEFFPIKAFKTDNLEESRVAFEDCESQEFEPVIDTSLMVTSNFDVLYSHVNDSLGTDSSEKKVVPIRLNGKGSKRRTSWRSPRWEKSNSRSPPS